MHLAECERIFALISWNSESGGLPAIRCCFGPAFSRRRVITCSPGAFVQTLTRAHTRHANICHGSPASTNIPSGKWERVFVRSDPIKPRMHVNGLCSFRSVGPARRCPNHNPHSTCLARNVRRWLLKSNNLTIGLVLFATCSTPFQRQWVTLGTPRLGCAPAPATGGVTENALIKFTTSIRYDSSRSRPDSTGHGRH